MRIDLPSDCREPVQLQHGVISRKQALEFGMTRDAIQRLVRAERWQTLQRGVYSIYTGDPPRSALLWAAVLRAGPGAMLSHQTAAELFKLTDGESSLIHLTIPASRHVDAVPGLVIHRSTHVARTRHPSLLPPRTRLEETVLDLVQQVPTADGAVSIACAACQRRLTTSDRLARATSARKKMRWRVELTEALAEIAEGVHSLLEYRFVRYVERPHGLPQATRQARVASAGRTWFIDNLYDDYGLCVELDGKEAHPDHERWQDIRRANGILAMGLTTLRYGWTDVQSRPCQTATQIGEVLGNLGWPGSIVACGPTCATAHRRAATRWRTP